MGDTHCHYLWINHRGYSVGRWLSVHHGLVSALSLIEIIALRTEVREASLLAVGWIGRVLFAERSEVAIAVLAVDNDETLLYCSLSRLW